MRYEKTMKPTMASALALLLVVGGAAGAQGKRPRWAGVLSSRPASFNAFMKRNIGKTIDLSIIFDAPQQKRKDISGEEPETWLGGDTGPMFQVGGSFYRVENGGNERTWRTLMGYDKDKRNLSGTFTITSGVKSGEDTGFNYDLRWRPNFKRDVSVYVVNEKGRILLKTSGITLRGGHIQVPASAYKELGLDVRRDIDKGTVTLATPSWYRAATDDATFNIVYNSVLVPRGQGEKKMFEDFRPPYVLLQNGEFFLPPQLVQRRFANRMSTKWDAATRTMTLRRSQAFVDLMKSRANDH